MVGLGKLSEIFSESSNTHAMMWEGLGGGELFGVYVGWDFTVMGGVIAVTTVNRRKLVDSEVITSLMSIATASVERGEYS